MVRTRISIISHPYATFRIDILKIGNVTDLETSDKYIRYRVSILNRCRSPLRL